MPYELVATNAAAGPEPGRREPYGLVQGAIINPRTGRISVYHPLVVDAGTQPAVAPVVPCCPTPWSPWVRLQRQHPVPCRPRPSADADAAAASPGDRHGLGHGHLYGGRAGHSTPPPRGTPRRRRDPPRPSAPARRPPPPPRLRSRPAPAPSRRPPARSWPRDRPRPRRRPPRQRPSLRRRYAAGLGPGPRVGAAVAWDDGWNGTRRP